MPGGSDPRTLLAEATTPEGDPLPPALLATIERALSPAAQVRHENVAELRLELESLLFAGDVAPTTFNLAFFYGEPVPRHGRGGVARGRGPHARRLCGVPAQRRARARRGADARAGPAGSGRGSSPGIAGRAPAGAGRRASAGRAAPSSPTPTRGTRAGRARSAAFRPTRRDPGRGATGCRESGGRNDTRQPDAPDRRRRGGGPADRRRRLLLSGCASRRRRPPRSRRRSRPSPGRGRPRPGAGGAPEGTRGGAHAGRGRGLRCGTPAPGGRSEGAAAGRSIPRALARAQEEAARKVRQQEEKRQDGGAPAAGAEQARGGSATRGRYARHDAATRDRAAHPHDAGGRGTAADPSSPTPHRPRRNPLPRRRPSTSTGRRASSLRR